MSVSCSFGALWRLAVSVLVLVSGTAVTAGTEVSAAPSSATSRVFLDHYCVGCHNERVKTADLALDILDTAKVGDGAAAWEQVVRKLRGGLMPPAGRPRPDNAANQAFVSWLEVELDRAATANPNPGRTETFHRLNRAEYRNVIRDLLDLDIDVNEHLPADDASYGFDNMAGALKLSQSLMERYLAAAQRISRLAVGRPLPGPVAADFRIQSDLRQYDRVDGAPFGTRGGIVIPYNFPQDAEYDISVTLMCGPPAGLGVCDGSAGFVDPHELEISVDGVREKLFVINPRPLGTVLEEPLAVRVPVKAGPREVSVTFLQQSSVQEIETYRRRFLRPLFRSVTITRQSFVTYQPFVAGVSIGGPFNATGPGDTPSRRRIFVCRPAGPADEDRCARTILSTMARRAYRRPVTDADLENLVAFYDDGRIDGGFEGGIDMALRGLLASPEFLFRIEEDPANIDPNTNYRISDLELASRLSFFLWSSVPDDELLDVAAKGKLKEPAVLEQQVRRMLADARSRALVNNFIGQWLLLRNIEAKRPSELLFPDFDGTLRHAFRRETELLFDSILREDRSALELLTANYTFLNERLAGHYGVLNVKGPHFRRVTYPADNPRRGVLGHGSILLVTSHALRTSPVIRGKFILDNILGTPPPAPPANAPPLRERKFNEQGQEQATMRERMAEHRENPVCASCHSMIDPLGFALENFDPVGRWRNVDVSYKPIDTSGTLPDGTKFGDLNQFLAALVSHPERFVTNLTERLMTYALGRGLEYYDMPAVRMITRETARHDHRLSSLVMGIVESAPFQMRRSRAPVPSPLEVASSRAEGAHRQQ